MTDDNELAVAAWVARARGDGSVDLAQASIPPAPPRRRSAWFWIRLAAAIVVVGFLLDVVRTVKGKFVGDDVVPVAQSGMGVEWQKRCDYRVSFRHYEAMAGPLANSKDEAAGTRCPKHPKWLPLAP